MLTKPVWPAYAEVLDYILNVRSVIKFPWEETAKVYEKGRGERHLWN